MNQNEFNPEKLYKEFEQGWLANRPVSIESIVTSKSLTVEVIEELVHIELEFAWKQFRIRQELGQSPSLPSTVKQYLERFPILDSDEIVLRLLCGEVLNIENSIERGELLGQYVADYPRLLPDINTAYSRLIQSNDFLTPDLKALETQTLKPTVLASLTDHASDLTTSVNGQIGNYRLISELGRGGMGVVYKAEHKSLRRIVAIKMILGGIHTGVDELKRFRREAASVAKLKNDSIVHLYEYGIEDDLPYIVFEYIDGGNLADYISGQRQLSITTIVKLLLQIVSGISFAHFHGVIHRDLKPANVLIAADGTAKISDFGLAKDFQDAHSSLRTATDAVLGTPAFMSPEQAIGANHEIDHLTDIFSIGSIMYAVLTGQTPFQGGSPIDVMLAVQEDDPLPPTQIRPDIPIELELICLKCLEKEKHRRYQTAEELKRDLEAYIAGRTVAAKRKSLLRRSQAWYEKNQLIAILGAGSVGISLIVAIGAILFTLKTMSLNGDLSEANLEAKRSLEQARFAEQEALKSRNAAVYSEEKAVQANENAQLALREAQQQRQARTIQAYASDMLLMPFDWEAGNLKRIEKNLASYETDVAVRNFEWNYWKRVIQSNQQIFEEHSHSVSAILPFDNDVMVSVDFEGALVIWDMTQFRVMRRVKNHEKQILAVAGNRGGTRLYSAGADGKVICQTNTTGEIIWEKSFEDVEIHSLVLHPTRNLLMVGTNQGSVITVDLASRQTLNTFITTHAVCRCLALLPSGKLAVSGNDSRISIWDLDSNSREKLFPVNQGRIWDLQVNPEGSFIFSAGDDGSIKCWDTRTYELLRTLSHHTFKVWKMTIAKGGNLLGAVSDDQSISVWNVKSGKLEAIYKGHTDSIMSVAFSNADKYLITGAADKTIRFWDISQRQEVTLEILPSTPLRFVEQGAEDSIVIASETSLEVYSSLGDLVYRWEVNDNAVRIVSLVISLDGRKVIAGTSNGDVFLWDHSNWSPILLKRFDDRPAKIAVSSTGDQLAIVTGSSQLQIWELNGSLGKLIYSEDIGQNGIQKVWFAPDGNYIYIATKDYKLNVLSLQNYKLEPNGFQSGTSIVISMAWTADSKYLATGGIDKVIRIWELDSGRNVAKLFGHTNSVSSLSFSADGSRLVSSDRGTTVRIWDWQNEREVMNVVESDRSYSYVGFRSNVNKLLLASPEHGVQILDGSSEITSESLAK